MTYMELNPINELHFFDYDSIVTFMNRRDYLEFLYHIDGVCICEFFISTLFNEKNEQICLLIFKLLTANL